MADVTIESIPAQVGPIVPDLGMILASSARRFGPKPALIAGGQTLRSPHIRGLGMGAHSRQERAIGRVETPKRSCRLEPSGSDGTPARA